MRRRSAARAAALLLLLLVSLGLALALGIVIPARRQTPAIFERLRSEGRLPLTLDAFGAERTRELLQVQDPGFYRHRGIDLSTPGAGLTTITQAIVKRLYFDDFHPGAAKIRQSLIAHFAVDPLVGKNEQLTVFLNIVPLGTCRGRPVHGFEAAARAWFGRSFRDLSEDQFLSLVAMLIAPATFDPNRHPERNADRVAAIRRLLSGAYRPKGLMDLYYGGRTYRSPAGALRGRLQRLVWGY